jgi:hypothetical protein
MGKKYLSMFKKITNIPTILVLLSIFSSCSIRTKEQYNETKLSKIVEHQIMETIDKEVIDDFVQLKKTVSQIEQKNIKLQSVCDSLLLINSKQKVQTFEMKTYLFFNSSNHVVDQESLKNFKMILLGMIDSAEINKCKFYLTGYSDASGDSVLNIYLAQKRVLYVRNILVNEFCIPITSIFYTSSPNVISCNYSLYRSVKIIVVNNRD